MEVGELVIAAESRSEEGLNLEVGSSGLEEDYVANFIHMQTQLVQQVVCVTISLPLVLFIGS